MPGMVFHQKTGFYWNQILPWELVNFPAVSPRKKPPRITLTFLFQQCQNVYSAHVKTPEFISGKEKHRVSTFLIPSAPLSPSASLEVFASVQLGTPAPCGWAHAAFQRLKVDSHGTGCAARGALPLSDAWHPAEVPQHTGVCPGKQTLWCMLEVPLFASFGGH